jgi:hypothetical protein
MSEQFSQQVMDQIKTFINERGLKTGVPSDIAHYIAEQVPAGQVRIQDESWGEPDKWIYRGPVDAESDDVLCYGWRVMQKGKESERYERDLHDMIGPRWTVEILSAEDNLNLPKTKPGKETKSERESHEALEQTFTPSDDVGTKIVDQTYGQVNDAIFAAMPGTLAIRCEDWNNANAWVLLEEVKVKEESMQVLTINYSNGVKMPWHPSMLDLSSKNWTSKSPLE